MRTRISLRRCLVASALAVISLGATSCQTTSAADPSRQEARQPESTAEATAAVESSAVEFVHHYIETLEGGDDAGILKLFVDDGRFSWLTDGARSYSSPGDVLEGMRRYAGIKFSTTLRNVDALALSDQLAAVTSEFETELTIPGAENFRYGGVITWLLERDSEGGTWRVLRGHTSTPAGPPGQ